MYLRHKAYKNVLTKYESPLVGKTNECLACLRVLKKLALHIFSYFEQFTLGIFAVDSQCVSCNVDVSREMSYIRDTYCQKQRPDLREWKGDKQKLCITIPQKNRSESSHAVFGLG
jgi:hypothetical protein